MMSDVLLRLAAVEKLVGTVVGKMAEPFLVEVPGDRAEPAPSQEQAEARRQEPTGPIKQPEPAAAPVASPPVQETKAEADHKTAHVDEMEVDDDYVVPQDKAHAERLVFVGRDVVVVHELLSQNETRCRLLKGLMGMINKIDAEGDIQVYFPGLTSGKRCQWLWDADLLKLGFLRVPPAMDEDLT